MEYGAPIGYESLNRRLINRQNSFKPIIPPFHHATIPIGANPYLCQPTLMGYAILYLLEQKKAIQPKGPDCP